MSDDQKFNQLDPRSSQEASLEIGSISVESSDGAITIQQYSHKGPLPDPTTLQAYKNIDPAILSTVLELARENQKMRNKQLDASISFDRRAQYASFITSIIAFSILAFLAYLKQSLVPVAGIISAISVLGMVFFRQRPK